MSQVFVWTLDSVLSVAFFVIAAVLWLWVVVPTWIRQAICKHDGDVSETRACDAICCKCGKNLGFIGSWRKRSAP